MSFRQLMMLIVSKLFFIFFAHCNSNNYIYHILIGASEGQKGTKGAVMHGFVLLEKLLFFGISLWF